MIQLSGVRKGYGGEYLFNGVDWLIGPVDRVGLVGAAVSDLPGIEALCNQQLNKDIRISFSSLRADALSPELLSVILWPKRQQRKKEQCNDG